MFAISSTSEDVDETFEQMTVAIGSLLQKYDSSNIRYGLLIYAHTSTFVIHLKNNTGVEKIKETLTTVQPSVGPSAVKIALEAAAQMFSEAEERQDADRALVIMTDKNAIANDDVVLEATEPLEKMAVKIIAVVVGDEVDTAEFVVVTEEENIIQSEKSDDLGDDIMERVMSEYFKIIIWGSKVSQNVALWFETLVLPLFSPLGKKSSDKAP